MNFGHIRHSEWNAGLSTYIQLHSASFSRYSECVFTGPRWKACSTLSCAELLTEVNGYDLCVTEFLRVVDMLLPEKNHFIVSCPELHRQATPSGTLVRVQLLGQYP